AASSPPRNGSLEEPSGGKRDASLARTDKSQDSSPNLSPNQSPVGSLIRDSSQVNAISVLTLLDKLLHMVEGVQEAQHSMEARQGEVEKAVSLIQGEVADFSKAQAETGATVRQVLDKARKVSANVKDVRARLEKQSHDVKKLENNHAELIKRSNFRIMVYQHSKGIWAKWWLHKPVSGKAALRDECPIEWQRIRKSHSIDALKESENYHEMENAGIQKATASAPGAPEKTTNKRIDTMKRALTRQSIEKKVNKLGMKIVPQDRRDKIRKSFVPEHKKPTRANVSSFKVPPFKFTVKKIREGD
uniref:Caveolae associated protein 1 n=1 Tax=Petromyzon marinus TaxID=7757 RepID=S4RQM3_PETMA